MTKYIYTFVVVIPLIVLTCCNSQQREHDFTPFLQPGKFVDSDHTEIMDEAETLTADCQGDTEKAKALFEFVRDSYGTNEWYGRQASGTLRNGGNSCFSRSILLIALCRAVGIPARLHIQKVTIKDYKKNGRIENLSFLHGIAGIYLNEEWRLYELVANEDKWEVWTQGRAMDRDITVHFSPDKDCLFASNDKLIFETLPVYFTDWPEKKLDFFSDVYCTDYSDDLSSLLKSTDFIDSNHPLIIEKAKTLIKSCRTGTEKTKALFEFVRDFDTTRDSDSYIASEILVHGGISCSKRSVLLMALCRSAGIPAKMHLQRVTLKDYKTDEGKREDVTFVHSITGIHLNGEWHLYEQSGDAYNWIQWTQDDKRGDEMPVEFFPDRDCVFPSGDRIVIQTLPLFFSDWSEDIIDLKRKISAGEIGFTF